MCAVSIGLTVNHDYIIGVIYNPILDELYEATHLTPSELNGAPISVSAVSSLQTACVLTELGSDRSTEKVEWMVERLGTVLAAEAQCVRMMGSCALNMAAVAAGRADVLYEHGPFPWDMAAGVLIVRQAGGEVRGAGLDQEFELEGRCVLAFTPPLRPALGGLFEKTYLGRPGESILGRPDESYLGRPEENVLYMIK